MKFSHVNMVARDTDKLADFYKTVFDCNDLYPRKDLSGEPISKCNGVPNAEIYAAWLSLPGVESTFLEIFQYKNIHDRPNPLVNQPGYGHISFEVEDIHATYDAIIKAGGWSLGEVRNFGTEEAPAFYVYARDPEGNVIELEQHSG